jgi:hypothetical protein
MPLMGFESITPVFERAKTIHALDRAATVIGVIIYILFLFLRWDVCWIHCYSSLKQPQYNRSGWWTRVRSTGGMLIDGESFKYSEKTFYSNLFTINVPWTILWLNPGLRGKKSTINWLNHVQVKVLLQPNVKTYSVQLLKSGVLKILL